MIHEQADRERDTKKKEILEKDFYIDSKKIDMYKDIDSSKKIDILLDQPNKSDSIKKDPISLNNKLPELKTFNHSKYHYTNFINE